VLRPYIFRRCGSICALLGLLSFAGPQSDFFLPSSTFDRFDFFAAFSWAVMGSWLQKTVDLDNGSTDELDLDL